MNHTFNFIQTDQEQNVEFVLLALSVLKLNCTHGKGQPKEFIFGVVSD